MPYEILFALVVLIVAIICLLVPLVLSIVAITRTRHLKELRRRIVLIETVLQQIQAGRVLPGTAQNATVGTTSAEQTEPGLAEALPPVVAEISEPRRRTIDWEKLIGQKALGWLAVGLLVLTAVFFLRYAYQNNWIGPVGRVVISLLFGTAMVMGGRQYFQRGWHVLFQMLTGGGLVVVYLATYSAFGFYHLLPQQHAGIFLAVIIFEAAVLAFLYDSLVIALVSILGGLLTPLLMYSDHDSYIALFTYLAILDLGAIVLLLLRRWTALGSIALVGTQAVYWSWYAANYHPEKLHWALGFQLVVFLLFLGHTLILQLVRNDPETREGLVRLVLTPLLGFSAFYVLMKPEYSVWMGSAAMIVATIYAAVARLVLARRSADNRLLLACLAVAIGFIALAFPIQANTHWVAFGWAAMAAVLWWFGLRTNEQMLRGMSLVLGILAVARVLLFDMPHGTREPFIPVFNQFALPAIGVAICILIAAAGTRRFLERIPQAERVFALLGALGGVALLWLILSVDCYSYFAALRQVADTDVEKLRWLGQMSLSVLWVVLASVVLTMGFRMRLAPLRWQAITLYLVTVGKVLTIDIGHLAQFYRIMAFFVVAIVLGLAARTYQRFGRSDPLPEDRGIES